MDYTARGILQARVLEWAAFPFSRGSSEHRDGTQVSHTAGGFFTSWAAREALLGVITPKPRDHAVPRLLPCLIFTVFTRWAAAGLSGGCRTLSHPAGSLVAPHRVRAVPCGLSKRGPWAPGPLASAASALGLSCSTAHGIFVLRPGTEPSSPPLQGRFFTTGLRDVPPQSSSPLSLDVGSFCWWVLASPCQWLLTASCDFGALTEDECTSLLNWPSHLPSLLILKTGTFALGLEGIL